MDPVTRRGFLTVAATGLAGLWAAPAARAARRRLSTDIRIEEIQYGFEDFLYRAPMKFGGHVVDRVTLLNVNCTIQTRGGKTAKGFGSMPLGNVWAFPSRKLNYDQTLAAMKGLAGRVSTLAGAYREFGHPIDLAWALEPAYLKAAAELSAELGEPIPKLATLTTASPFDAAVHDAFGKSLGLSVYEGYRPEFMGSELDSYLGADFKGETLSQYVLVQPKPTMPLYHLVGALDPLDASEVEKPLGDGLPETLADWIQYSGLTHIKIKLNGDDLTWDVDRVLRVERVCAYVQSRRRVNAWVYSLDFNERCQNVGYLIEALSKIRERAPQAFERIHYVEQPTARDLAANRQNVMHEAARLKPVVIDESLTDLESLLLAREMGYTGVALKACKGQSQALLMGAAAQKYSMFLCVQDLTCPGASLIQSAGLAAHVPGVAAIEANARQYVPAANKGWEDRFPGIFKVTNGVMDTSVLNGAGLGAIV